jgi:hypothetical protein
MSADQEARGALMILTAQETYVQDGVCSPERMLGLLDATVERALNDGFPGMAACAAGDHRGLAFDA